MNKKDFKILFMGTPIFACNVLKKICEEKFNVCGVFCQPDKPQGRGMKLTYPPVKEYAISQNLPVFQPEKLKENVEVKKILDELKPDVIVVVAYGKILPKYILDFPKFGCINIHASLLPKYRGAAPIQWSIINGETKTGVTIMYMDEGMDTGNMISKSECEIYSFDTYETLHDKLQDIGADAICDTLNKIIDTENVLASTKQPEEFTLAPMLNKENTHIDFNQNAHDIVNLVRGINPIPCSWCQNANDETAIYKIYKASVCKGNFSCTNIGEVVHIDAKQNMLVIRCKNGFVNIEELKPAGSRKMASSEFIRGGKIKLGDVLI